MCGRDPTVEESADFIKKYGLETFFQAVSAMKGPYLKALAVELDGRAFEDVRRDFIQTGLPLHDLDYQLGLLEGLRSAG